MRSAHYVRVIAVLTLIAFFGTLAFAQTEAAAATSAPQAEATGAPASPLFNMASPKPQTGGGMTTYEPRRFEFSVQFGGSVGGNMGELDTGNCVGTTDIRGLDTCDPNQSMGHRDGGIWPGRFGGARAFQRYGRAG